MRKKIFISMLFILGGVIAARAMGQAPEVALDTSPGTTSDIKASEVLAQTSTGTIILEQITTTGQYFNPRFSPDGEKIFAVKSKDEITKPTIWNLIVMDKNGKNEKIVLTNMYNRDFDISPNGDSIAYCADIDNVAYLVVASTSDMSFRILEKGIKSAIKWSPNGTRIAYRTGYICIVNSDGSGYKQLGRGLSTISWSPNERYISYVNNEMDLITVDIETGKETTITKAGYGVVWATTTKIYYVNGRNLRAVDTVNGEVETIVEVEKNEAVDKFRIRGDYIYYLTSYDDGHEYYSTGIWRLKKDGTRREKLIDLSQFKSEYDINMSISPNNRALIYDFMNNIYLGTLQ